MRVLGIDPGYERVGIALLDGDRTSHQVVFSECFQTDKTDSPSVRLQKIGEHIENILDNHTPERVALETLFFNTNQKTALLVSEVRGIIRFVSMKRNVSIFEYTPSQIKIAVTGYGKSDKRGVADMLTTLLNLSSQKRLDDEYDALGVALTCLVSE